MYVLFLVYNYRLQYIQEDGGVTSCSYNFISWYRYSNDNLRPFVRDHSASVLQGWGGGGESSSPRCLNSQRWLSDYVRIWCVVSVWRQHKKNIYIYWWRSWGSKSGSRGSPLPPPPPHTQTHTIPAFWWAPKLYKDRKRSCSYMRERPRFRPQQLLRGDIINPHSRMTKTCWCNIGNLFVICMWQVTKSHLYHLLGVLDYYVMYRHRAQSVLWNICKGYQLGNWSLWVVVWDFFKCLWLEGENFDVSPSPFIFKIVHPPRGRLGTEERCVEPHSHFQMNAANKGIVYTNLFIFFFILRQLHLHD